MARQVILNLTIRRMHHSYHIRHLYAHTFVVKEAGKERAICSSCGKEFANRGLWQQHAEKRNCLGSPKTIFPCNLCGKIFTRKDNLREHLKAHAGSRTRQRCVIIEKILTSWNFYRPLHSCNQCGKKFGSGATVVLHMKSHTGKI